MKKETGSRLRWIFGICLSCMLIITALCLIGGCISIYRSGDQPYSPQSVAEAFSYIAVPVWLCIGLVLIGILGRLLLPVKAERTKPGKQLEAILDRLTRTADMTQCPAEDIQAYQTLQQQGIVRRIVALSSVLVAIVAFSVFLVTQDRFPLEDVNGAVARTVSVLLPCLALPFAGTLYAVLGNRNSIQKEIAILKQLPKRNDPQPQKKQRRLPLSAIRITVLALGIGILVYGFLNGGTADVLVKAINICTECVGLG